MSSLPKLPLRLVFVLPFLLQILGVLILVGGVSYRSSQASIHHLVDNLLAALDRRIQDKINHYFSVPVLFTQENAALLRQNQLDGNNLDLLEQHFIQQLRLSPDLSSLAIANERREFLAVERPIPDQLMIRRLDADSPDRGFYRYSATAAGERIALEELRYNYDPHKDPPGNPWYGQARDRPEGTWLMTVTLSLGQDQPALQLARFLPYMDESGQFQGVVAASVYLTQISSFLRSLDLQGDGQVFLIERNGLLIATSTPELPFNSRPQDTLAENVSVRPRRLAAVQSQNPLTAAAMNYLLRQPVDLGTLSHNQRLRFPWNHEHYILHVSPINGELDWLMVMVLPESAFLGRLHQTAYVTLLLSGLALLLAGSVGSYTADRLTRSLRRAIQSTQVLVDQETHQPLPNLPNSHIFEINQLFRTLDVIRAKLQLTHQERQRYAQGLEHDIAEKTVALEHSETRLRETQHLARIGSWEYDPEQGTLFWSDEIYHICAFTEATFTPHRDTILPLIYSDDRLIFTRQVCDRIQANQPFEVDVRITTSQNQLRSLHLKGHPVITHHGRTRFVGVLADISDRKQLELALEASEFTLKSVLDSTPVAITIMRQRQDGTWLDGYQSAGYIHVFGYSVEDISSDQQFWLSRVYPEDRDRVITSDTKLSHLPAKRTIEYRFYHKDNSLRWIAGTQVTRWEAHHHCFTVTMVEQDITERKRMELALVQSESRFQQIANSSPAVIYIVEESPDGPVQYHYLSPAFEAIHELSIAAAQHDPSLVFNQMHPEDRAGYQQAVADSLATSTPFRHEWRIITPSGTVKWIQAHSQPSRQPSGAIMWYGIVQEVSDRKRAEQELHQAKEAAEAANQAKSTFLATMSHELRTPLNIILGFTQLMERDRSLNEENRQRVQFMHDSGSLLLRLINEVLDLSKLDTHQMTLHPDRVDIFDLLHTIHGGFQVRVRQQQLNFPIHISESVPQWIIVDANRLRQILMNLLDNAIKFTSHGSVTLSVHISMDSLEGHMGDASTRDRPPAYLIITVTDTGVGMTDSELAIIFDAFSQGSAGQHIQDGTGLGLTISRRLARLMGGDITVRSTLGQGSQFQIILPISLEQGAE